jgi:hypothetical protein
MKLKRPTNLSSTKMMVVVVMKMIKNKVEEDFD